MAAMHTRARLKSESAAKYSFLFHQAKERMFCSNEVPPVMTVGDEKDKSNTFCEKRTNFGSVRNKCAVSSAVGIGRELRH